MKETREYPKFKFLPTNREIDWNKVERLKESFLEYGIIEGRPLLIDEDFNIVDGQHRFYALKDLKLPIFYEIIKGNVIGKTMIINSVQSSWKLQDYVKSYSRQGLECYRQLLIFEEKYKFSWSTCLDIVAGKSYKPNQIKKGIEFIPTEKRNLIAEFIYEFKDLDFYKSSAFVRSLVTVFNKGTEAQINKLRLNRLAIPRQATTEKYYTVFENIINTNQKGEKKIKLLK